MRSNIRPALALLATLAMAPAACRTVSSEEVAPPVSRLTLAGGGGGRFAASHAETLEAGRALYTGRCVKCHAAKPLANYSAEEWTDTILPKEAPKAKLSPDEAQSLVAYILAARDARPDPAAEAIAGGLSLRR